MCVSYPGLVLEVEAGMAVVEIEGRRRRASLMLMPDLRPGEWVVVSAGTVIERLEPEQAAEITALLDDASGSQPPAPEGEATNVPT